MQDILLSEVSELINHELISIRRGLESFSSRKLAIFGCGQYGRKTYRQLREFCGIEADCFIDNNEKLRGGFVEDKPVLVRPWETDLNFKEKYLVLTASSRENSYSMERQLREAGVPFIYGDAVHVTLAWERIAKVAARLDDDVSKLSYLGVMYYFLTFDDKYIQTTGDQYFAVKQFVKPINEIIVDCGAYTGDTTEEYVRRSSSDVSKIYAFEPYEKARRSLIARVRRLNEEYALDANVIEIVPSAVGAKSGKIGFSVSGNEYVPSSDSTENEMVSLDEFFIGRQAPTLIKADIEGGEMSMLHGAGRLLDSGGGTNIPLIKLAVCIYHSTAEFYTIPEYILQLNPNYRFAVRSHSATFQETVLYAY